MRIHSSVGSSGVIRGGSPIIIRKKENVVISHKKLKNDDLPSGGPKNNLFKQALHFILETMMMIWDLIRFSYDGCPTPWAFDRQ